jgi:hypothetical protein
MEVFSVERDLTCKQWNSKSKRYQALLEAMIVAPGHNMY